MTGTVQIASPTAADTAAVLAVSPLAADLTLQCGPFHVPAALAAATPTLEQERSEPARVLENFIDNNPWQGMGAVSRGGWMLLGRDEDTMVFGRREGAIGLGTIVTLVRDGDRFTARGLEGSRLCPAAPRERIEPTYGAVTRGDTVTVTWNCGQDDSGVPSNRLSRVELLETGAEVHFLLVSEHNPDQVPIVELNTGYVIVSGQASFVPATFALREPLGDRALLNDVRIPAAPVDVEPGPDS